MHRLQSTCAIERYERRIDRDGAALQRFATDTTCNDTVELCLAGRMESDTVRLTYRGGVRGVSMLAQMLEEQGVSVRYALPRETRDLTEAAAIVVVVLSATGNIHDIAAAVQMFRQKFGSRAQIEGLPEPSSPWRSDLRLSISCSPMGRLRQKSTRSREPES